MSNSNDSKKQWRPRVAMVTGASGFIGSNLVKILLDEGIKVRALVRKGDPLNNLYGLDVEQIEGDLLDPDSLRECLKGCDTLFHLAAIYAYWLPDPSLMYRINIHGTINLLNAALDMGIERVVYTSSMAGIGSKPGNEHADETTIFNDWLKCDHYIMSKYISECEALKFNIRGLHVVAVNPTFPFGANDIAPTPTGVLVQRYVSGKNPVWLPGGFNGANVKDIARGHFLAAMRGRPGERYILGGHNVTYKEFGEMVCRIADVPLPKYELKPGIVSFLGRINEWIADNITHREPLFVDKAIQYTGGRFLWMDCSKARDELGYQPSPLEEAVKDAVVWFQSGRDELLAMEATPQLKAAKA